LGVTMNMYLNENKQTLPYSGHDWYEMPIIDWLVLQSPYISTNNQTFYKCPADMGMPAWNFALASIEGWPTNQLLYPCSYYYFYDFYTDFQTGETQPQKLSNVSFPACKAVNGCEGCPAPGVYTSLAPPPEYSQSCHGWGLNLLFVDGHSQFARWIILNRDTLDGGYNLDWTSNGLAGKDLNSPGM